MDVRPSQDFAHACSYPPDDVNWDFDGSEDEDEDDADEEGDEYAQDAEEHIQDGQNVREEGEANEDEEWNHPAPR